MTAETACGPSRDHLDWPFYADEHRALAGEADAFIAGKGLGAIDHHDADASCKALVAKLGDFYEEKVRPEVRGGI